MSTLRAALHDLAERFASDVLAAIRSASLQDLLAVQVAPTQRGRPRARIATGHTSGKRQHEPLAVTRSSKGARLARRSPADIEQSLSFVVGALKAGPMRSEQIQKALGLDKRELPRVLKHGLATRKLKSKGQKRATMYYAA